MLLHTLGAPDQSLVRTFEFVTGAGRNEILRVKLEYVPPNTLNEQAEQEKRRIVGRRKMNAMEDLVEQEREMTLVWHKILTSRVHSIDDGELSIRKLATLVSLDAAAVKANGGLDAAVWTDLNDETPVTDEERTKGGFPKEGPDAIATRGQAAVRNVLYLMNASRRFKEFVEQVIQDVSFFQDPEWEKEAGNSGPGAATSSERR